MANLAVSKWNERWLVAVHTKDNPSDQEWDHYVVLANEIVVRHHAVNAFIFSDGGHPTVAQRRRLAMTVEGTDGKTAVVTDIDQGIARLIINTVSIFNPGLKAFSSATLREALMHVGISENQGYGVIDLAKELSKQTGPLVSLRQAKI